jgi:hypothetical protein
LRLIKLKMAKLLSSLLIICLINNWEGYAQSWTKPHTVPLKTFSKIAYVVIPTTEVTSNHVKTKRVGRKGDEFLNFVNIILPESYTLQKLLDSKDAGSTGLFNRDKLLITMAVLPDMGSGQVQWVPIKLDSIPSAQHIEWKVLAADCYTRLFNYKAVGSPENDWSRRRLDLRPVIKEGNQYFTTRQAVLTEYFLLRDYPTWYPTTGDNATINRLARPFTPTDYLKELELVTASTPSDKRSPLLGAELSSKLLLQAIDNGVYSFWSLRSTISHGSLTEFGAGSLRFKPDVGLVSGKYASFFLLTEESELNRFFDVISIKKLLAK